MSNRIQLFPQFTPYELPARWGRTFTNYTQALAKARNLRAHTVEIRDINRPYSRGLLGILKGGKDVSVGNM